MTDWTPGPWVVAKDENKPLRILASDARATIVADDIGPHCNAVAKADARLIAAAPDLFEALRYARRFLKPEDHDTAFVDAALAKARGETQ